MRREDASEDARMQVRRKSITRTVAPVRNSVGSETQNQVRRLNGIRGQTLNVRTILFLVILLDKTVSVG